MEVSKSEPLQAAFTTRFPGRLSPSIAYMAVFSSYFVHYCCCYERQCLELQTPHSGAVATMAERPPVSCLVCLCSGLPALGHAKRFPCAVFQGLILRRKRTPRRFGEDSLQPSGHCCYLPPQYLASAWQLRAFAFAFAYNLYTTNHSLYSAFCAPVCGQVPFFYFFVFH
jgi:hypothetical protein